MTLPYERIWAILNARTYLLELLNTKGPIRKRELRQRTLAILRHYPTESDMRDPSSAFEQRGTPGRRVK